MAIQASDSYTPFAQVFRRPPNFEERVIRRQNKIEQVREVYISRRLKLTSEESEKFWPIYRRYQDALTAVKEKQLKNSSKADGADQVNNELFYEGEIVKVRQFYTNEFLKILPPEKVSELLKAEKEFRDELIKQLRERPKPAATTTTPTTTPSN